MLNRIPLDMVRPPILASLGSSTITGGSLDDTENSQPQNAAQNGPEASQQHQAPLVAPFGMT